MNKLRSFCFFLSVFSFLSMGKPQHSRRRGKVSFVNSCIPFPSASQTFRDQSGESTRAGDFFLQNQPLKMFYKKGIFRNFVKLRRKHLRWSFFLIKSKTPTQTFSCEIYELFKNTYFEEHLRTTASTFNPFHITALFLYPLKISKTLRF